MLITNLEHSSGVARYYAFACWGDSFRIWFFMLHNDFFFNDWEQWLFLKNLFADDIRL